MFAIVPLRVFTRICLLAVLSACQAAPGTDSGPANDSFDVDCAAWMEPHRGRHLGFFPSEGYLSPVGAVFPTSAGPALYIEDDSLTATGPVEASVPTTGVKIAVPAAGSTRGDGCLYVGVAGVVAAEGLVEDCAPDRACASGSIHFTFIGLTFEGGAFIDGVTWVAAPYVWE